MKTARMLGWSQAALILVIASGCGRSPLTPVHGKAAYKGFALQNGVVVFTPDVTRGESGPIAFGKIREDGTYTLYTGDSPGASSGWYRVTVSSLAATSQSTPGSARGIEFPQSIIPEKYRDPELSLLACEVKAGRSNTIDLNLD